MQDEFLKHIQQNFPFLNGKRILLAISGGIDSVVLAHLCKAAALDFSLAHCNFQLRGEASDADAVFVEQLAEKFDSAFFKTCFETKKIAEKEHMSTQLAARELRYRWFAELMEKHGFDFLFTAHHADDSLETFLMNTTRGTGLQGLTGIPEINGNIVRPLLPFSRKLIKIYAKQQNIAWREDHSNASDAYFRNRVRHHIVPLLKEENKNLLARFLKTQENLQQAAALLEDYTALLFSTIVTKKAGNYRLAIQQILKTPHPKAVLYQLLKDFGFTAWDDIYELLDAQVGKQIFSTTHRLVRDRDFLELTVLENRDDAVYEIACEDLSFGFPAGKLQFSYPKEIQEKSATVAYFSSEKIQFPLRLRRWKAGDRFRPFGMKGSKKVSDFLKDEKCSPLEKEQTWVLCVNEKILWVVGYRIDDRFKVTENAQKILKIKFFRT